MTSNGALEIKLELPSLGVQKQDGVLPVRNLGHFGMTPKRTMQRQILLFTLTSTKTIASFSLHIIYYIIFIIFQTKYILYSKEILAVFPGMKFCFKDFVEMTFEYRDDLWRTLTLTIHLSCRDHFKVLQTTTSLV